MAPAPLGIIYRMLGVGDHAKNPGAPNDQLHGAEESAIAADRDDQIAAFHQRGFKSIDIYLVMIYPEFAQHALDAGDGVQMNGGGGIFGYQEDRARLKGPAGFPGKALKGDPLFGLQPGEFNGRELEKSVSRDDLPLVDKAIGQADITFQNAVPHDLLF